MRARRLAPLAVRDAAVRQILFSDRASRKTFRDAHFAEPAPAVPVRLRALDGRPLFIRPGSDDPWVLREVFTYRDVLPPDEIRWPRLIFDLGANIGASMALLAETFPEARIVGVEPDPGNVALCRRNVEPWSDRCRVVEAAVWPDDGRVGLRGESHSALAVDPRAKRTTVRAASLDALVEEHGEGASVDFVKVDIEGAEASILTRNTDWASRVRAISVEVHRPYQVDNCVRDLAALGFQVKTKAAPREPRVIGLNAD